MNREVYVEHVFNRLSSELDGVELIRLGERLKTLGSSRVANVSIQMAVRENSHAINYNTFHVQLEAGKPLQNALNAVEFRLRNVVFRQVGEFCYERGIRDYPKIPGNTAVVAQHSYEIHADVDASEVDA